MSRRYDSEDARNKVLAVAVEMFLNKGFHQTKTKEIYSLAGVTASSMYNALGTKDDILYELVVYMFENQFSKAKELVGEKNPLVLYALETALQLAMTELSEKLRDVYVEAYSQAKTSEYIYKQTAKELYKIFGTFLPDFSEGDFYEMEIGSGGMIRGYMSVPCNQYFTLERKVTRFLSAAFDIYHVPKSEKNNAIAQALSPSLKQFAMQIIEKLTNDLKNTFVNQK